MKYQFNVVVIIAEAALSLLVSIPGNAQGAENICESLYSIYQTTYSGGATSGMKKCVEVVFSAPVPQMCNIGNVEPAICEAARYIITNIAVKGCNDGALHKIPISYSVFSTLCNR